MLILIVVKLDHSTLNHHICIVAHVDPWCKFRFYYLLNVQLSPYPLLLDSEAFSTYINQHHVEILNIYVRHKRDINLMNTRINHLSIN